MNVYIGRAATRFAKLNSALMRRQKQLPTAALTRCRTVGQLLKEVTELKVLPREADEREEWPAWGMMWGSMCSWRLRRQGRVEMPMLLKALEELIQRHVALRSEMIDPYDLFKEMQYCLSVP